MQMSLCKSRSWELPLALASMDVRAVFGRTRVPLVAQALRSRGAPAQSMAAWVREAVRGECSVSLGPAGTKRMRMAIGCLKGGALRDDCFKVASQTAVPLLGPGARFARSAGSGIRRRRTIPKWGPSPPVYQQLVGEVAAAIVAGTTASFKAIAELTDVACSILLEVKRRVLRPSLGRPIGSLLLA